MKRIVSFLLIVALLLTFAVSSYALKSVPVQSIKLDKSSITLDIGKTYNLKAVFTPANTTQKLLTYSSSDKNVAAIDKNGKITAIKDGKAVITVTSTANNKVVAKCNVTVNPAANGKLFSKPVTLKFLTDSHPSYPYDPNWWVYKAIEKATNVHLDVTAVPMANYVDKFNLIMASGDIPDILFINDANTKNKYATAGAFVDMSKKLNAQTMPNFYKLYNASKSNQTWVKRFVSGDGDLYSLPNFDYGDGNRMNWMYRDDIFKANGLYASNTYEGLYTNLKVLKAKYPDSYPFSFRNLFADGNNNRLNIMASQWGTGYPYYFDEKTGSWKFGPEDAGLKGLVMWLNKLYKEKLIPTDFLTTSTQQWEGMMSTDKSMVSIDYTLRVDQFNKAVQLQNPNYNLKFMIPPVGTVNGKHQLTYTAFANASMVISASSKKIDDAIKYCDWLYSSEARDLVSWGKEGETYKVVDGKRTWIKPAGSEKDTIEKIYGLDTMGSYLWFDSGFFQVDTTPQYVEAINGSKKWDAAMQPQPSFNEDESKINSTAGQTIATKLNEEITKFILGQKDFSQWDNMVKDMKALGVDQMLKIMNDSYNRTNK